MAMLGRLALKTRPRAPHFLAAANRMRTFKAYRRYIDTPPLEDTPRGRAPGLRYGLWAKRPREAVPLDTVLLSSSEGGVSFAQSAYAHLPNTGVYLQNAQKCKTATWAKFPQRLVRAARLLRGDYTLASRLDAPGIDWGRKDVAQKRERLNSLSENDLWRGIVDASTELTNAWFVGAHQGTYLETNRRCRARFRDCSILRGGAAIRSENA